MHRANKRAINILFLWFLVIEFLVVAFPANALLDQPGPNSRQLGLAVSPGADPWDPSARSFNPAGAALRVNWGFSATVARSFGLPELDRFRLDTAGPLGSFVTGVWASGSGRELYTERSAGAGATHLIHCNLYGGINIGFTTVSVKNYSNDNLFFTDAGLLWLNQRFSVGLSVLRAISTRLSEYSDTRPPRIGLITASMQLSSSITMLAEAIFEQDRDPGIRLGLESEVLDTILLRIGYDSSVERIHLGIGITFGKWSGAGAYDHHPELGWSNAFGISWRTQPVGSGR